jgi:hypothetical protein
MAENGPDAPEPTWTLGPISVKRTTDILALVAFILSVIGLVAQVRDNLRGSNPTLFIPEQVTFGSAKALNVFFQNNEQFLITTAMMNYVNDAPAGFNAAIGREYIRFQIDGKKYQYAAHQTVDTSSESSTLKVKKKEDSGPFALNAGSAVTHEVLFEPHPVKCAVDDHDCAGSLPKIKWIDFIAAAKANPVILVTLVAEVYGKGMLSVQCTVTLNDNDLNAFNSEDQQWAAPNCQEQEKRSFWKIIFWPRNSGAPIREPSN